MKVKAQCWTSQLLVAVGNVEPKPQMSNTGKGEQDPQTI
jgi:hypothetical protein